MHRVETRHFWFRGTRKVILEQLRRALGPRLSGAHVLDLGCGTGYTLSLLPEDVHAVGLDMSRAAISYARTRAPRAELVQGSAYELPFDDASFDAVLALDVLEHLEEDTRALSEIQRVLAPNGVLIATVPAFAFLWSDHDEALDHQRRYRLDELTARVRDAGLGVELSSYYNFFLFPVVAAGRVMSRLIGRGRGRADLEVPSWPLNETLFRVLASERHLVGRAKLPFGVSCIVVARKQG
jgi:SAM-dependent methyltransferase